MRIDAARLQSDLEALAAFGRGPDGGVTRPALGPADREAREWLRVRMQEAGLQVSVDAAANITGRLPSADPGAQAVIIGSHIDTVPDGGMFDGALGVLGGLECARVIGASGAPLPWHLEVINFTDEEGARNTGLFGSRAMMGLLAGDEVYQGDPPLAELLEEMGLDPTRISDAQRDPETIRAYFELHIEQGSRLEAAGLDLGIVTGIVGIYRYVVSIAGQANHAGTTPMDARRDALVSAAPLFHLLPRWARARSCDMVATIGRVDIEPGAVNVIPGRCTFPVELRSLDPAPMVHVRDLVVEFAGSIPGSGVETALEMDGVSLDPDLQGLLETAARADDLTYARMPSGAGHDAQSFAPAVPAAMLFVPSRGGLSHCPGEWTDPGQAAAGVQVLLTALLDLAVRDRKGTGQ